MQIKSLSVRTLFNNNFSDVRNSSDFQRSRHNNGIVTSFFPVFLSVENFTVFDHLRNCGVGCGFYAPYSMTKGIFHTFKIKFHLAKFRMNGLSVVSLLIEAGHFFRQWRSVFLKFLSGETGNRLPIHPAPPS